MPAYIPICCLYHPRPALLLLTNCSAHSAHVAAINIYETIFADDPFSREAWNKYLYNLLALGSSQDEATVLEGLLGGPPTVHALVSWLDKQ